MPAPNVHPVPWRIPVGEAVELPPDVAWVQWDLAVRLLDVRSSAPRSTPCLTSADLALQPLET